MSCNIELSLEFNLKDRHDQCVSSELSQLKQAGSKIHLCHVF